MNVLDKLSITAKGMEEVEHRTSRLSIRKRSVLVQLKQPQSIAHILDQSVFHQDQILYEIAALAQHGFISVAPATAAEGELKT